MIRSAPSWVFPGSYLENIRFLSSMASIASIELLFFIYDQENRALFQKEKKEIEAFSGRFGFTAHLPDPLLPEHEELIQATSTLVRSYVFHPATKQNEQEALASRIGAWRSRFGDRFFMENTKLSYFDAQRSLLTDLPLCCDVGHLLMEGQDPARWLSANAGAIREIHLHGIVDGKDHSIFSLKEGSLSAIRPFLRGFAGTVEIEVFSIPELETAMAELDAACAN